MAERLTPGVYVVEVSGGAKTIQGVSTSTAGFIGEAARGIPDRAEFVNGFSDFDRKFGGHRRGEAGFLAQAVEAFFNAGGRRAYVIRVLPADAEQGASEVITARTPGASTATGFSAKMCTPLSTEALICCGRKPGGAASSTTFTPLSSTF